MKKILLPALFLVFFCIVNDVHAQGLQNEIKVLKPNFNGTWKCVTQTPKPAAARSKDLNTIMVIEQKLSAIAVTLKMQKGTSPDANFEGGRFTLYTDGRGDEWVESSYAGSFSRWEAGKLVITHYIFPKPALKTVVMRQEWSLSPDGRTFTQTARRADVRIIYNADRTYREEYFFDDKLTETLVWERVGN